MKVDFLIVGQGVAGTLISYQLQKSGRSCAVIDQPHEFQASRVAGGIIHPYILKGRSIGLELRHHAKTAIEVYQEMENLLGQPLLLKKFLAFFHDNETEAAIFRQKAGEKNINLSQDDYTPGGQFNTDFLYDVITPVWQLKGRQLLDGWKNFLEEKQIYFSEYFNHEECRYSAGQWFYKNLAADAVIFCEGPGMRHNPFIQKEGLIPNCGDVLLVKIPGLDPGGIYEKKFRLIHWQDDIYWYGTSHRWKYIIPEPDLPWRIEAEHELNHWLSLPFQIIDHLVAERPTTAGQAIFARAVEGHASMYNFNGLGTRGFTHGPEAAIHFCQSLLRKQTCK